MKLRNTLLLLCLAFGIILSFSSCQKEASEQEEAMAFVGTWKQLSRTIDGTLVDIDSSRFMLQIDSASICILYDSTYSAVKANKTVIRSGWSYTNGLFNIAVDLPASYSMELINDELKMDRTDFAQDGSIVKTSLNYQRIATIEQE